MGQHRIVGDRLGVLLGPVGPADALLRLPLAEAGAGVGEAQLALLPVTRFLGEFGHGGQPPAVEAQSLAEAAVAHPQGALLAQQPGAGHGVVVHAPGQADRLVGLVVVGRHLGHVAERLGHTGHVGAGHAMAAGALDRPLVEAGGFHVGVLGPGPVGGHGGVPPAPGPVLGPMEVQRQQLRAALRVVAGPALERRAHRGVQLLTAAERQTVVGHLPVQGVLEPVEAGIVGVDESGQRHPPLRMLQFGLVEGLAEQRRVDDRAEHRAFPQQQPVAGIERVDPGRDQRLDGVGRAGLRSAADELEQEQRIRDPSCQEVVDLVVAGAQTGGDRR